MNMQASMGKLLEAVETLKLHSKDQSDKLASVAQEMHDYNWLSMDHWVAWDHSGFIWLGNHHVHCLPQAVVSIRP